MCFLSEWLDSSLVELDGTREQADCVCVRARELASWLLQHWNRFNILCVLAALEQTRHWQDGNEATGASVRQRAGAAFPPKRVANSWPHFRYLKSIRQ